MTPALLTLDEVAARFGKSRRTINRWAAQRILPVTRLGSHTVGIRPVDLEKALEKRTTKAL